LRVIIRRCIKYSILKIQILSPGNRANKKRKRWAEDVQPLPFQFILLEITLAANEKEKEG
jgi:hypothetical protein